MVLKFRYFNVDGVQQECRGQEQKLKMNWWDTADRLPSNNDELIEVELDGKKIYPGELEKNAINKNRVTFLDLCNYLHWNDVNVKTMDRNAVIEASKVTTGFLSDALMRIGNFAKELWFNDNGSLGVRFGMNDYTINDKEVCDYLKNNFKINNVLKADRNMVIVR